MKKNWFIFMFFAYAIACKQDIKEFECENFPTNNKDSVCLNAYINPDTNFVNQRLKSQNGNVLVVFSGLAEDKSFLNKKYLSNPNITKELQRFLIIQMFVDERAKLDRLTGFTIGERNMQYQINKFGIASQPYYVILSNGKVKCTSGYILEENDIVEFLKECK